jgi:predicted metal-dependent hydrolase
MSPPDARWPSIRSLPFATIEVEVPSLLVQLHLPFLERPAPREIQLRGFEDSQQAVEFVRVRRARRYILRVRPDGSLRVTVPRGGSRREAEQFVSKHQRWIAGQRTRAHVAYAPRRWAHGSEILLNGEPVQIGVDVRGDRTIVTYGSRRLTAEGTADVRAAIEQDLRELARTELVPRLRELATQHGLEIGTVSIRNQRSRWGSCARSGNIALNFRLVQMPPDVRDYVLVHELMHLKQQNHSRRFWRLVAAACPAFRDAERWLHTTGKSLF